MPSPFPNPPTDGQVFNHPNGIEYVWSDAENRWNIVYGSATNTGSLPLLNPSTYQSLPSSVPDVPAGTVVQADYNQWLFDPLQHVNSEANIEVEPAPGPNDPDEGRLWYDSSNGKLYIYYNDGNSTQWVEIGGGGDPNNVWFGSDPPDEDEEYQFWWDTDRLELLIYFNDQW